jgi:AraC family transcriptional activator FtrA
MSPLEIAVASDFLGDENDWLSVDWYRFSVCTPTPGAVPLKGGITLQVDQGLEAMRRADTVIIPGWCGSSIAPDAELIEALQRTHARGARLVSFCTGAFALGHAGVLDGRRATTHWELADRFAEQFPAVEVDPSVLYVRDGGVWTSAGSAASIDCALAIVRHDHGADVANELARDMVVAPHREGGQAQFVAAPLALDDSTDSLATTLDWAVEHLDEQLTVAQLADHAHLSPRQFTRRFRDLTGTTPLQWLLAQQVILARRLLETTDLPVERIAADAGFGSAAALRMHFQRELRTNPQSYRRSFRASA